MSKSTKKDLKFILIFIAVLSISLTYLFQSSYAKYRKQIKGNVEYSIANWKVLINTEDITNKAKLTNNIEPRFEDNVNVKNTVIAPGSTGYFDITFDATDTDVNFKYEITSIVSPDSDVTDLKVTDYIINPDAVNKTKIPTTTGIVTGNVLHNTPQTKVRIFVLWDDSATNNMDNTEDTRVAITEGTKALINTAIKLTQVNS